MPRRRLQSTAASSKETGVGEPETSTKLAVIHGNDAPPAASLGLGPPSVNEIASLRQMATEIAATEFVPSGLRNRPAAVLAAILTGRELGIGPMAALKQISVIDGKPTLSAELMLALIRRAGHKVEGPEPSDTGASLTGIRRDTGKSLVVTFDQEDARKAQLLGKPSWQRYPRSMYWARCVSMLARMHFSDVLMGMIYTPEEMGADVDEDNQVIEMRQTTGVEAKLDKAMKTPDEPAKEVNPSQPTQTSPVAPSTPKTPSSAEKSPSPAATPTAPTSAAPGGTDTTTPVAPITPVASTTTAAATAPATSEATTAKTDPNASPGAATASPSPVAATPSPASAEPPELAFGEAQSDTAKELRRQALEKAMQATRLSAERRTPGTQYSDAMIEAKAKLAIANWFKTKRSGVELEQASSEDLMALIEAIDVTLQG